MMNDRLCIVGSHPEGRNIVPWDDMSTDIWTINEAATTADTWVKRTTAIFQLHPRHVWDNPRNKNDPHHGEWLKANQTVPVYMLEQYPDVPMAVKYPIDEISDKYLTSLTVISKRGRNRFYTCTPAYMCALAAYLGYKQVDFYGVELSVDSEYRFQRPGTMFWLGILTQYAQVKFYGRMLDAPMYGYEVDGEIRREDLVARLEQVRPLVTEAKVAVDAANASLAQVFGRFRDTGVEHEAVPVAMRALTDAMTKFSNLDGRRQELERRISEIDVQLKVDSSYRFSHHEFTRAEEAIVKEREKNLQIYAHEAGVCDGLYHLAKKYRLRDSLRTAILDELNAHISALYILVQKSAVFAGAAEENKLLGSLIREQMKDEAT